MEDLNSEVPCTNYQLCNAKYVGRYYYILFVLFIFVKCVYNDTDDRHTFIDIQDKTNVC